jgi:transcriptional regulator of acetoin/glycerol metabolism
MISHSQPVMEVLFEQLRHSDSMVILANAQGVLMHTLGDLDFLTRAQRVALACGANWRETERGTNAIGTALVEGRAVQINGAEHYLERNGFLTCAAAPILSARQELLGILDISGDQRGHHAYALGLASTAARMIENRLLLANHAHQIVLHLHTTPEGLSTVAEGLVVVSADGWITGANQTALHMMGISAQDLGALEFGAVFDGSIDQLAGWAASATPCAKWLRGRRGQRWACTVDWQKATPVNHGMTNARSSKTTDASSASANAQKSQQDMLASSDPFAAIDTGDQQVRAVVEKARRVAGKPIAVLLQGESGVGKEWLARAIHKVSHHDHAPFVAINCAAIAEHLIEAELFGYAPGAFTGASKQGSAGLLRQANGGTLFLDEIGDMPLHLQNRLLRVLQERQVVPVGAQQAVPVDFNLICATHCHLKQAAQDGTFRTDLFYRINGLTLSMPPLRERTDLATIAARMLKTLAPDRRLTFAPSVKTAVMQHPWPGNLRQLHSVLQTAVAMLGEDEHIIDFVHLSEDWLQAVMPCEPTSDASASTRLPPDQSLQALNRQVIEQVLQAHRGNVSAAARTLGISRQTLYRKLQSRR